MNTDINKHNDLCGELFSGKSYLSLCIDEMLANIYAVTGVPAVGGANELAFPSCLSGGRLQDIKGDILETA
jgi:hypothetical protein